MENIDCRNCDNFQEGEPIKVVDVAYNNPFMQDQYHFEDGFKCTWNGIESLRIEDLQKGNCRCKGVD